MCRQLLKAEQHMGIFQMKPSAFFFSRAGVESGSMLERFFYYPLEFMIHIPVCSQVTNWTCCCTELPKPVIMPLPSQGDEEIVPWPGGHTPTPGQNRIGCEVTGTRHHMSVSNRWLLNIQWSCNV